jgi:hypothetical protein
LTSKTGKASESSVNRKPQKVYISNLSCIAARFHENTIWNFTVIKKFTDKFPGETTFSFLLSFFYSLVLCAFVSLRVTSWLKQELLRLPGSISHLLCGKITDDGCEGWVKKRKRNQFLKGG